MLNSRNTKSLLSYESLEERKMLATLAEAGISQTTIDYIDSLPWTEEILNDEALQNTLDGIIGSQTAPADAVVLTSESQFSQIQDGGTYLIQGDITVTQTLQVPSNTTIYVDGSIYKQGNFTASGVHSAENRDDAIFEVTNGASNIRLIGVDNALLHSNPTLDPNQPHSSAVIVEDFASDVLVEGFEIGYVWQALDAQWGTENIVFQNNHIHDTLKRAIWYLGSDDSISVHNFIENPGVDGIDFDAFNVNSIAYENVVVGAGRWAGFVEEGAQNNYFVRGLAVMADFGNPNTGFQLGWADNGTTQFFVDNNPGILTSDNYFIDNVIFRPSDFPTGGDYFAKENAGKGPTYFWANRGFGAGQSTIFDNAEWLEFLPTAGGENNSVNAVQLLDDLDQTWNPLDAPAFQEVDGLVSLEAENYSQLISGFGIATGLSWNLTNDALASGGTSLVAGPDIGLNTLNALYGPQLNFEIDFLNTGSYTVFLRTLGENSLNNSVHVGLDGEAVTTGAGQGVGDDSGQWTWTTGIVDGQAFVEIDITTPGRHVLNIWMREDGTALDKIVLNQSGITPIGLGPNESPISPQSNTSPDFRDFAISPNVDRSPWMAPRNQGGQLQIPETRKNVIVDRYVENLILDTELVKRSFTQIAPLSIRQSNIDRAADTIIRDELLDELQNELQDDLLGELADAIEWS